MSDYASSLPVRTQTNGDVVIRLVDGTTTTNYLSIDAAGLLGSKLYDAAGVGITSQANGAQQALDVGINVAGVQIDPRDIRALAFGTDSVTAVQGAAAATHASPWWTRLTDGTNDSLLLATGELTVAITQPLPAGTNLLGSIHSRTQDGAGTDISSRTLGGSQWLDVVDPAIGATGAAVPAYAEMMGASDGTNLQAVKSGTDGRLIVDIQNTAGEFTLSNPLPVVISTTAGGAPIADYKDATAIAVAGSDNHDYTVPVGKTFYLQGLFASASGKSKMVFQIETGAATNVFTTIFVLFNSTANPNMQIDPNPTSISAVAGARVRVTMSNLDLAAQDLYSTILGYNL